ncbi:XRE family transcriptional regulator [Slackia heliotrinireducens]|uniref:4-diphosphocytidyl-2-methyl-D-erythritol synthase n=1 Tax=Slackia heliotrinireducens (strain ATCC 29202 / DSM 20476 / NCTC 11029 / RHS 1) TaxID=471855 RepID=C7N5T2_SLAHD|nr:XRE family transcriptional regulator [Slackia heliotrinireducens]ACV22267.1 4-diphosphocytidyl-2-methyl-D-erythritol synthase [Slackia heliotrinireducens DSM 20476]
MTIATNIKLRRLELGLTQDQLARAIGYRSRSAVAKIESDATDLPVSKLLLLAQALDTTPERLLEGAGEFSYSDAGSESRATRVDHGQPRVAAVILAGGRSSRNMRNVPNQFISILGRPVVDYCMEAYQSHPMVDEIYVVCLEGFEDIMNAYARRRKVTKLVKILPAGKTGVLSARKGYQALCDKGYRPSDIVVFQESTRPFVTEEMITGLIQATREKGSVITGEVRSDNVQFFQDDNGGLKYLDRNKIIDLQSPDAHKISVVRDVFKRADNEGHELVESNIGMLMYNLGFTLNFREGARNNIKILREEDVAVATALLKQQG